MVDQNSLLMRQHSFYSNGEFNMYFIKLVTIVKIWEGRTSSEDKETIANGQRLPQWQPYNDKMTVRTQDQVNQIYGETM